MRNVLLLFFVIGSLNILTAQDFEFDLYFEDSKGFRDTVSIGFAEDASLQIDSIYGEVNIVGIPLNANIDVRLTNWEEEQFKEEPVPIQTKKQVYDVSKEILTFEISTPNFPVRCYWNEAIFKEDDNERMIWMTSINPGGWFDTGSPSDLILLHFGEEMSPRTFSAQTVWGLNENYGYLNEQGDTISLFWLGMGKIGTPIREIAGKNIEIDIFPNPTYDEITVQTKAKIESIAIFNTAGNLISQSTQNTLSILNQPAGVYLMKIQLEDGGVLVDKILKH